MVCDSLLARCNLFFDFSSHASASAFWIFYLMLLQILHISDNNIGNLYTCLTFWLCIIFMIIIAIICKWQKKYMQKSALWYSDYQYVQ